MVMEFTWCVFIVRVILFSILMRCSNQYPQTATSTVSEVQLKPEKDVYELKIQLPDNGFRNEIAKLQPTDTSKEDISVTGFIQINFIDNNAVANWTYTADKNGFLVRYIYKQSNAATYRNITPLPGSYPTTQPTTQTYPTTQRTIPPATYLPPTQSLSPGALKSAGG